MKKSFPLVSMMAALLLTACGGGSGSNSANPGGNSSNPADPSSEPSSNPPAAQKITLIEPDDVDMISDNCKAYIDDMRALRDEADDPYKYHEISLNIEDSQKGYLDTGDVNGQKVYSMAALAAQ